MRHNLQSKQSFGRRLAVHALLVHVAVAFLGATALSSIPRAQTARPEGSVFLPRFFDPKQRLPRPEGETPRALWFVTEDDYPPFNFNGPDGQLTGFNVDLARLICEDLQVACTIQARRWDTFFEALENRRGDAIIASMAITPALRERFQVSQPYYRTPARFVARSSVIAREASPAALAGLRVAVAGGTAHEAYLNTHFAGILLRREANLELALDALRRGDADAAFGDGIALAFWLNGEASAECCRFLAGAFTESRYFGEGAGIVLRKADAGLRQWVDYALARITADGRFARLYLRYFPIGFY